MRSGLIKSDFQVKKEAYRAYTVVRCSFFGVGMQIPTLSLTLSQGDIDGIRVAHIVSVEVIDVGICTYELVAA
jgi:hypothetical protein